MHRVGAEPGLVPDQELGPVGLDLTRNGRVGAALPAAFRLGLDPLVRGTRDVPVGGLCLGDEGRAALADDMVADIAGK